MTNPIPSKHTSSLTCWSNFMTYHKYTSEGGVEDRTEGREDALGEIPLPL